MRTARRETKRGGSSRTTRVAGRTSRPLGASRGKPSRSTIFLSYRHASPTTEIANKLYEALGPPADTWGAQVFMDDHDIEPADLFDQKIIAALDSTTHFIALLTNSYWNSTYCRKEVARVVER